MSEVPAAGVPGPNELFSACAGLPCEPRMARLLGLYPQVQPGLWLQRVKVQGGDLTADQWRLLGRLARRFTPRTPLHLTTRQDVELHDLTGDIISEVQRGLTEGGLTGVGACGDTVRNITVCPCSGLRSGAPDLSDLAWAIRREMEAHPGVFLLPRKFKVSLSACPQACSQPWINDVGLVAVKRDGRWGFRVIAAGSLGPRPAAGMLLHDWLETPDVLPLVLSLLEAFNRHGDREHRHTARLRHVRQRLGDAEFARLAAENFQEVRSRRSWPEIALREPSDGFEGRVLLTFGDGDVSAAQAEALGDLAARQRVRVRIDTHHRVAVFGPDEAGIRKAIGDLPSLDSPARPQACVVACPGKRWCQRGLVDTAAAAACIRQGLGERLPPGKPVCISGCPNGCAQSTVAPIGVVGVIASRDGQPVEAFDLWMGGGLGQDARLAQPVARKLSLHDLVERIRQAAS